MDGIDELAQSMLARCASHGHSVAEVADRHAQEALRAELRRLARPVAAADPYRRARRPGRRDAHR